MAWEEADQELISTEDLFGKKPVQPQVVTSEELFGTPSPAPATLPKPPPSATQPTTGKGWLATIKPGEGNEFSRLSNLVTGARLGAAPSQIKQLQESRGGYNPMFDPFLAGALKSVTGGAIGWERPMAVSPLESVGEAAGSFLGFLGGPAKAAGPAGKIAAKGMAKVLGKKIAPTLAGKAIQYGVSRGVGLGTAGVLSDLANIKDAPNTFMTYALMGEVFGLTGLAHVAKHPFMSQVIRQVGGRALLSIVGLEDLGPEAFTPENLPQTVFHELLNTFFLSHGTSPKVVFAGALADGKARKIINSLEEKPAEAVIQAAGGPAKWIQGELAPLIQKVADVTPKAPATAPVAPETPPVAKPRTGRQLLRDAVAKMSVGKDRKVVRPEFGEVGFSERMQALKDRAAFARHQGIQEPKKGTPLTKTEEYEQRVEAAEAEYAAYKEAMSSAKAGDPEALKYVADSLLRGTGYGAADISEFKKNAFMDGEAAKKIAKDYASGTIEHEKAVSDLKTLIKDTVGGPEQAPAPGAERRDLLTRPTQAEWDTRDYSQMDEAGLKKIEPTRDIMDPAKAEYLRTLAKDQLKAGGITKAQYDELMAEAAEMGQVPWNKPTEPPGQEPIDIWETTPRTTDAYAARRWDNKLFKWVSEVMPIRDETDVLTVVEAIYEKLKTAKFVPPPGVDKEAARASFVRRVAKNTAVDFARKWESEGYEAPMQLRPEGKGRAPSSFGDEDILERIDAKEETGAKYPSYTKETPESIYEAKEESRKRVLTPDELSAKYALPVEDIDMLIRLGEGATQKEVATELGTTDKAIERRLSRIRQKFNVPGTFNQLVADVEYLPAKGPAEHAGEGGWSPEALGRREIFFVLDTRTGKRRPLFGVDAVDYQPKRGEVKYQANFLTGKVEISDTGPDTIAPDRLPEVPKEPKVEPRLGTQFEDPWEDMIISIAAEVKAPWQMTKAELSGQFIPKNYSRPKLEAKAAEMDATLPPGSKNEHRELLDLLDSTTKTSEQRHEQEVRRAIEEGKPVPQDVLADYPDMIYLYSGVSPAEFISHIRKRGVPEQLYQAIVNENSPIEKLSEKAKAAGRRLSEIEDPQLLVRSWLGEGNKINAMFDRGVFILNPDGTVRVLGEGVGDIVRDYAKATNVKNTKVAEADLDAYIVNNRIIKDLQRPKWKGSKENIASPAEVANAESVIASLKSKYGEQYGILESTGKRLTKFQSNVLEYAKFKGLFTQEEVDKMRMENPNFIHFERELQEVETIGAPGVSEKGTSWVRNIITGKKGTKLVPGYKPTGHIRGSPAEVLPSIGNIYKYSFRMIDAADKNGLVVAISRLAKTLPEEIHITESKMRPITLTAKEGGGTEKTIFRPAQTPPTSQSIPYRDKGEQKWLTVDKSMYRALNGLGVNEVNFVGKGLGHVARLLQKGATMTPEFISKNLTRDQWDAYVQTQVGFHPGIDVPASIADILGKREVYLDYLRSGSAHAGLANLSYKNVVGQYKKLLASPGAIKKLSVLVNPAALSRLAEESTRLSVYKAAKKSGKGMLGAGFTAAEATVDFRVKGYVTKNYAQTVAFLNAGIQSPIRYARAWKRDVDAYKDAMKSGKGVARASLEFGKGSLLKGLATITVPTIALYMINKDNPNYQNKKDWEKNLFWLVPIGGKDATRFVRIPKPFVPGFLFGTMIERLLEYQRKNDPEELAKLGNGLFETVSPVSGNFVTGILPTAIKPLIENVIGWSFFKESPLFPEWKKGLPSEEQYGPYTSKTAIALGRAPLAKISGAGPGKIENIITSYGGGMAKYALSASDLLIEKAGLEPQGVVGQKERLPDIADYPLMKGWLTRPVYDLQTQALTDFYDNSRKVDATFTKFQSLAKAGMTDKARPMLTGPEIKARPIFNTVMGQISNLRKAMERIVEQVGLTRAQKQEKLTALSNKIIELANKANNTLKKGKEL